MKHLIILALLLLSGTAQAREYEVSGPQGSLAMDITLPDGFNPETQKCPMVILMHGIFSSGNIVPMPALARELAKVGIASIRFDFGGHWRSEGEMQKMTIANEIKDALAIWEYAKALPYVSEKYMETYGDRSELIVVKGGNHMITRRKKAIVAHAVAFFDGLF